MTRPLRPSALRYTLGLLFLINLVNFVDRQVVNILAEPIKQELQLADWHIGVISGLAFAIFYSVLGIPLGRCADSPRIHRGKLISVCLAAWSCMTAFGGLAGSFTQLLAARVGVAVGEAGCSPTAHSLITEIVPSHKRAAALALYSSGIPVGKLLGLLIGGAVAQMFGWRMAFLIVGLPGILLALLCWLTLPDPRTRTAEAGKRISIAELMRFLAPLRTFWLASLGAAFLAFLSYGQAAFLGSFLIRVHHLSVGEAGLLLGLAAGLGGMLGAWMGGLAADRRAQRDRRAYMLIPAAGAVCGAMLFIAATHAATLPWTIGLLTAATATTSVWYGPIFATIQGIVPSDRRATAASLHLFVVNLIGIGLGPLAFGLLSDGFNHGLEIAGLHFGGVGSAEGVRYALTAGTASGLISVVFLLMAARNITRDMQRFEPAAELAM